MKTAIWAMLSSGILTAVILPGFIKYLRQHDEGQQIRPEGPKWHEKKSGTPTMGGLIFTLVIMLVTIGTAAITHQLSTAVWLFVLVLFLYGAIGFADDSVKLKMKRNLGLTALQKFLAQVLTAILFLAIYFHDQMPAALALPFLGVQHSLILFAIFAAVWLVGFSNAVNLTDGLDGLVGGLGIIAYGTYAWIAYQAQQQIVLMICLTVVGALFAFLLFNHKPARIFMGDVGSLALGGGLAVISLILQRPWSLLLIGLVFVVETASVMLQVVSFHFTGRRIFKMAPLHHHFEMSGWSETKVVLIFWLCGLLSSGLYLLLFK